MNTENTEFTEADAAMIEVSRGGQGLFTERLRVESHGVSLCALPKVPQEASEEMP